MGCSNYTTSTCGSFYSNTSAYICKIPPKGCCEDFVKNKSNCNNSSNNNNTCYESSTCHNVCHSKKPCDSNSSSNSNYYDSCYEKPSNCSMNSCYPQNNCNSSYAPQHHYNNCQMPAPCLPPQINCNEILSNHLSLINQALATYSEADNLLNGQAEQLLSDLISLINQILALTCQGNNTIDKSKCLLKETNCAIPCCNNLLYNAIEKYDLEKSYLNSVLEALDKASKGLHNASCMGQQGSMYLSQYIDCVNSNNPNQGNHNCNNNYYNNCNSYCH